MEDEYRWGGELSSTSKTSPANVFILSNSPSTLSKTQLQQLLIVDVKENLSELAEERRARKSIFRLNHRLLAIADQTDH